MREILKKSIGLIKKGPGGFFVRCGKKTGLFEKGKAGKNQV